MIKITKTICVTILRGTDTLKGNFKYNFILLLFISLFFSIKTYSQIGGGLAKVKTPTGGLAIDGGLIANTPTKDQGDWADGSGGTGKGVFISAPYTSPGSRIIRDEFNSSNDDVFKSGKFNDDPTTMLWTKTTSQDKSDINWGMFHIAVDDYQDTWIMMGGDRFGTVGSSYFDFEFMQAKFTMTGIGSASGGFEVADPVDKAKLKGGRTPGDFIISMEFGSGGAIPHFLVWTQVGTGYKYVETSFPAGAVYSMTNTTNEPTPFGAFGSNTYKAYSFVESAVNINKVLQAVQGKCAGVAIKTLWIKTKASTAETAALKDFLAPQNVDLKFGVTVTPTTPSSTLFPASGQSLILGITSTTPDPDLNNYTYSWSIISKPNTGNAHLDNSNSATPTFVLDDPYAVGTYRIQVIATSKTTGCNAQSTVDVLVSNAPIPTISCPGDISKKCASEVPAAYSTLSQFTTDGGSAVNTGCTGNLTLELLREESISSTGTNNFTKKRIYKISNTCGGFSTCEQFIYVNDTEDPTINGLPSNITKSNDAGVCGAVVSWAAPTSADNCTGHRIEQTAGLASGSTFPVGTTTITYTATDGSGNTHSESFTVTVNDTEAPAVPTLADVTGECSATATPPTTTDNCTSSVTGTTSDPLSYTAQGTHVIHWTFTDGAGNKSYATQNVIISDATPPTISNCPQNLSVSCLSEVPVPANVTATDGCGGQVTIVLEEKQSNPGNSCSNTITRVWTATDAAGNSSTCTQTITIATPPRISCPADVTLSCNESTNPNDNPKLGKAVGYSACSSITVSYTDANAPAEGNYQVIARTWKATDANNKFVTCIQYLKVPKDCPAAITSIGTQIASSPENTAVAKNSNTSGKSLQVQAYPNPFFNSINFRFLSPISGKVTLEVYDLMGRRLAVVYQGTIDAGVQKTLNYKIPVLQRVPMIYKLSVGDRTSRGKLLPGAPGAKN